jgi:hypothetical protein
LLRCCGKLKKSWKCLSNASLWRSGWYRFLYMLSGLLKFKFKKLWRCSRRPLKWSRLSFIRKIQCTCRCKKLSKNQFSSSE